MGQIPQSIQKEPSNIQALKNQYQLEFINFRHTISILSYNILADIYCEQSYFSYADFQNLKFLNRSTKIIDQLKNFNADILCLQEVDNIEFYQDNIKNLQYDICYCQRPQRSDGCLIAFKIEKFKILISQEYSLDQLALDYGLPLQYLRQNVFQIVRLEHLLTKKQFIIGNIHTFWNPNQDDLKFFQIVQLVQFMEAQKESEDQILIFCGDFNSLPKSNPIQYIQKNNPIVERIEMSTNQIKLQNDIFQHYGPPKLNWESAYHPFPTFTNYTNNFKGCIDYIYYHNAKVEKILSIPNQSLLQKEVALPNSNFPSDHVPILAYFDFHC
ncbi:unnamed protein product (macronuclear) [Paramecium tetraurelia]|uniref:Endonuclease/exonuclease/phosphatase domain-containing protein n=1 Tax=Paramecium tetraurelia TaxID=5888 RepID=A0E6N7_PARTE|nr:uncharacterized protein GSPATT00003819001 [Paramecium tetraurelia]CAK90954.1 unnamed protein product [Paramecium tetraurelia]|eukprot:XP_001458351.1 hypothetical protein (macronuclear) [Paramecium tetraurelia strain d4-2]